ncbi:MAG: hypothetical protein FDZ75_03805 [Actinobacteria bacterium]|nr:MAG: hypothetical protein FDZ75_03805 [Actinomycetota bacterium]
MLERRDEVFGRGLTWRYPLTEVTDFRPADDSDGKATFVGFAWGQKRIRMGTNLDVDGASQVCEAVWRRYPSLRADR